MPINVSGGMANARRKQRLMKAKTRQSREERKQARQEREDGISPTKGIPPETALARPISPDDDSREKFTEDIPIEYHPTKLGKFLDFIDPFIIVLIIVNAIQMGLQTFSFVENNPKLDKAFELVDQIFLIIFTVEVILNFIHHNRFDRMEIKSGKIRFAPKSDEEQALREENFGWLVFDASVVIMSWAFAGMSIIRAFRIFRVLRLISRVEKLKAVVKALVGVMPKMGLVGFLLTLLFLIFGIAFTLMFGDLYEKGLTKFDYFSQIDRTFLTLFQIMTFDSWQGIAREVMAVYPWSWIMFILWTVITGFVAMNLIIAIICESLVAMTEEKRLKEEMDKKLALKQEMVLAKKMETLGVDTELTKEESERIMKEVAASAGSVASEDTMDTTDYVFQLEDMVEEIIEDQEKLIDTVQDLRALLQEVLENPPTQTRAMEIHSILRFRPKEDRFEHQGDEDSSSPNAK